MNNFSQKTINFLILFPFVWLVTGLLWLPRGSSYMSGVCVIAIITIVCRHGLQSAKTNIKNQAFLWILLLYFLYAGFSYYYHGYGSRELRALFFAFAFLVFLPPGQLNEKTFSILLLIAGLGICMTAVYQHFFLSIDRAHGFMNSIVYAAFSALCAVNLFTYAVFQKTRPRVLLFFTGFLLTLTALVLTNTRGVLLAAFIMLPVLIGIHIKTFAYIKKTTAMLLLLLPIVISAAAYPIIKDRMSTMIKQFPSLAERKYADTSVGLRLQMWESSLISIKKHPVIGLGDDYRQELNQQYQRGLISKALHNFNVPHYHNQFIDKMMKNGLIGLLLLMALLIQPLYKALRDKTASSHKLSIIGMFGIVIISGLTDVPLNHAPILYFYFFIIAYHLHKLNTPDANHNAML